jgi:DNA replication protein DnaC
LSLVTEAGQGAVLAAPISSVSLRPEGRAGCQGRITDYLTPLDFAILDELGNFPFAQAGGQLLFHLVSRLYERTSIVVTTNRRSEAEGRIR